MPAVRRHALALALALTSGSACLSLSTTALADDANREAAAHFTRGVTYYGEGDYPAALVEFDRAYAIAPTWRVLFNIGQAHFQLREYLEAHDALERFLREGGEEVQPKQRELAESELASLRDRIGQMSIESNVEGATVTVDDHVVGVTPLGAKVPVSAGIRRVAAVAEGRAPIERRVPIAGGDSVDVHLDFPAPAASPPAPPASEPVQQADVALDETPPDSQHPPNRLAASIALGAAAAGVAVGTTFGVLALGNRSRLDRTCENKACPAGAESQIDALSRNALISNAGFGVAIAGAVVGVTLWLVAPGSPSRSHANDPRPRFSWTTGPGGIGGAF